MLISLQDSSEAAMRQHEVSDHLSGILRLYVTVYRAHYSHSEEKCAYSTLCTQGTDLVSKLAPFNLKIITLASQITQTLYTNSLQGCSAICEI